MTAPDAAPDRTCHEAIRSAGSITELLDVLWEHARNATDGGTTPTSTSQLRLMYLADRADGIRMRAVCQLLASAPSTVTRMCDRLQAVGFLERLPCPGNGREIILRLTPAGTRHLLRIREQRDRVLHRAISSLPATERRALATGLAALQAQLDTDHGDEDATPAAHSAA
ncbi:MarR family transcriptional regulator [Streptomyces sp. WAC 04229]|uniref:MarR family winged helix-turn-helix transcriptional regulator n=1 Tax=Streptomyces sp. WAC 04229 TaxID=2203206 RepID=UPI000F74A256|nr:MarR family transcriptional regulator [Streptomyces sp. WAC 04229]RSN55658.1 MarR family transcriptional regulator [Streptomyces sp. WAC 04229]